MEVKYHWETIPEENPFDHFKISVIIRREKLNETNVKNFFKTLEMIAMNTSQVLEVILAKNSMDKIILQQI